MPFDAGASSSSNEFKTLRAFIRDFIAVSGKRFARATLYVALGAIVEGFGLVLLVPLLSLVTEGGHGGFLQRATARVFEIASITTPSGRLSLLLGGFIVLMTLRGVVLLLRDIEVLGLQANFVEQLRGKLMNHLTAAGWARVLRLRHARVLHVISGDMQNINVAAHFLLQSGISLVILVTQCALAFWLAPDLALAAFALLIVGSLALMPMLRRARTIGVIVTSANLTLTETASQFLNGLKLALSQGLQQGFTAEFGETLRAVRDQQVRYFRQQAGGRVVLTTLSAFVGAAAVLVGYGALGIGAPVLIAFLLIIARMSGPATLIQQGFQQIAFGLPAYEQAVGLLDELRPAPRAIAPEEKIADGAIILEAVSFFHPVVEGFELRGVRMADLHLAPGVFVGIAGPSGAGKTTLADLLVGLLQPETGRILIGGMPLSEAMLPAWRAQLSYISQEPFLFHDSIRRNLLWANPAASEAELWDALSLAGAESVVRGMNGSLDAVVGERGSLISGGERQRIALARAVLRKPRLLVMDEATNAIDIPSERALLERLLAVCPRMTIVMIAHRPESLALCDQVFRMEDGMLHREPARAVSCRVGT